MLYMDLVRFKRINDIFGHATGDRILTEVADRYRGRVRASDTVARVGATNSPFCLSVCRAARTRVQPPAFFGNA